MKTIFIILLVFLIGEPAFAQEKLTLERAKVIALESNNRIKVAQQNIEAAKATSTGMNAAKYPNISISSTGFYFGKPISGLIPEYGAAATLAINQGIYNGGKVKLGIQAAKQDLGVREAQKAATRSEVLLDVERGYWHIVGLNKRLKLLSNYQSLLESSLKDLNNSLAAGTVYKNDVLRAQVNLNTAALNIIRLKDELTIASLSFAQKIGLNELEPLIIDDTINDTFPAEKAGAGSVLLATIPEIEVMEKIIERQKLEVERLKSDHKPSIGLNLNGVSSAGKKGINFGNPNSNTLNAYYGLLSINIPIWDGGANRQKIKAQKFVISTQEIQLEDNKQLLSIAMRKAHLQVNEAARRIELTSTSLAQAEENLRLSNDRFRAGTILSRDLLEAQYIWEQVNSDVIEAKVQYKISEAELKKAMGMLN